MIPLYRRALGDAFETLPAALRHFHGAPGRWRGSAHLTQGNRMARLAARQAGYPDAEGRLPLTLTVSQDGPVETWLRDFDGHAVTSRQTLRPDRRIAERIGPATILLRTQVQPDGLAILVDGLRSGPFLLPPLLTGGGFESCEGDGVRFDVSASLPGIGLLIRYRGTLHPA